MVLFFATQLLSAIFISAYLSARGMSDDRAQNYLNDSTGAQFIFMIIYSALLIFGVWIFLRHYRQKFSLIGFKKPRLRDPLYGLAAVPVYFGLYLLTVLIATQFFPSLDINQQQEIGFKNVSGAVPLALAFVSLVILPPLVEEISVRGFLYSSLRKAMPLIYAAILTSLLFAIAHLPEGGDKGPLYIAAIDTFVLSLILVFLREKTGSLWAGITLHAIKNFIAFVALFALHFR